VLRGFRGRNGFGNSPGRGENGGVPADATAAILERRAELLSRAPRNDPELVELTDALEALLADPPGLRRVTLDASPDRQAEARRLAAMEPVNPVADEADLLDRFDADRRVFVLVHEALGDLPANIVWVALRKGLPDGLADVLDPTAPSTDPHSADTAVFYSIWNVEPGLAGMGGGRELIELASAAIAAEFPGISTQVTLSPVPGFRRWLSAEGFAEGSPPGDLESLCARYLCAQSGGRPKDPVARFHMGNGARLLRVLSGADPSERGLSRAWGMMASYRYEPEERAANRAALAVGSPAIGDEVRRLLPA